MAIPLSKIQVVNLIMSELARNSVVQANDDTYSQLIDHRLDNDLEYVLSQATWWFACKYYQSTSPDVTNPSPDWNYAFTLPPDFLLFAWQRTNPNYWIMGQKILSNSNFIQYYYIASTTDYGILPNWFVQALVYYTAMRVAKELTQNEALSSELAQKYSNELSTAKMQNAMQVPVYATPYNPYVRGNVGGRC